VIRLWHKIWSFSGKIQSFVLKEWPPSAHEYASLGVADRGWPTWGWPTWWGDVRREQSMGGTCTLYKILITVWIFPQNSHLKNTFFHPWFNLGFQRQADASVNTRNFFSQNLSYGPGKAWPGRPLARPYFTNLRKVIRNVPNICLIHGCISWGIQRESRD